MKIALVSHNVMVGDGQSRAMLALARHARGEGCEVTVVSNGADRSLQDIGCEHVFIPLWFRRPHLLKTLEFAVRAGRWARRTGRGFDVVHAVGFSLTAPHTVNTCQFVHGAWLRSSANTSDSNCARAAYQRVYTVLNARWERKAFNAAKAVVAVSGAVKAELIGIGVNEKAISVIPNGVDLSQFRGGCDARPDLGFPKGRFLFLFSGDIRTYRKNLDTVLAALARVPESIHLVVAGAPERSPFVSMSRKLGVEDRVHFIGFRKDLPEVMRAVDAFVFPSRYEACALVLLEAAATELPVITSRGTGGAEFLSPNSARFMNDPNDVAQLAHFMEEIAASPPLRRVMAKAARLSAERCSWERVCHEYMGIYRTYSGRHHESTDASISSRK